MEMVKTCTKCGESKPLSMYYVVDQRGKPYVQARCKVCQLERSLKWKQNNKERANANRRAWASRNRATDSASARMWAKNNPERLKETHRRYYAKNLVYIRTQSLKWAKDHPERANANAKKHRMAKRNAVPAWANQQYISDMYMLAKLVSEFTGEKYHVDHIVPVQSKIVCGLHVQDNLQVIPGAENIRKKNHHWPHMP